MTEPKTFKETQLPPIKSFRDTLRGEDLKEEDYQRAQETWSCFGCKTLKYYHDHYLKTDVLLLADVFEHFRWTTYASHRLDCLHFVTLPSLTWAMALKHTDAKLDLITDPQAYLMIEISMRGGIATISKRYACANNHLLADFDPSKENKFIIYLDANSMYATAQCEPLPVEKNFVSYRTRRRRNSTSRRSHPMAQQVTSSSAIWSIPTASTTPITTIRWPRNISRCHETCAARSL